MNAEPTTIRLSLPKLHSMQAQCKAEAKRFNVLDAGRRSGKNVLGIDRLIEPALLGFPTAWFAPTYKLLAESWRDCKVALGPAVRDKSEQEHRLELISGGTLECWSLDDEDPARGRKYRRIVVDEAAKVRQLLSIWESAIRPTLTDLRGDAWFLSTPKGLNDFYTLYQRGVDPLQPAWKSWQFATACNPHISADEIEAARGELPERVFAQEYRAEFLSDGAGVFRGVQLVSTAQPQGPQEKHNYVFGVDWGRSEDFTCLSVIDCTEQRQVWLDRFNRIEYAFQTERLAKLAAIFKPRAMICEANSMGQPLVESLARMNLPVTPWTATNATKAAVIENLSLAIERQQITLLDDPIQVGELLAYDAERTLTGLLRYGAPPGKHDDTVIALALAYEGARIAPRRPNSEYGFGEGWRSRIAV